MRRKIVQLLTVLCCGFFSSSAQDTAAVEEQDDQHLFTHINKILGGEVEKILNPLLFETVIDWLGTPYKYAGDCRKGIDCSGFTGMLYKKVFGIELANNSAEIYNEAKPLKKSALEEGDLVFFKIRKKRISHVGIYLGNNKFAHASVQNGVIVSDLDEPYYKKHFYKGGRVKKGGNR